MKNERKAFEEWFCKNHTGLKPSELIKFRTDNGYSFKDSIKINCMWESWQASAQRQGYKLVPVEPTERMLDAARRRQWDDLSSPLEDMDTLKYKAMIGVSE